MNRIPRTELLYARAYERFFHDAWQPAVRGRRIGAHAETLAGTQWLDPERVAAEEAPPGRRCARDGMKRA